MVSKTLVKYLKAHQGRATYLVAAVGSGTAGGIALQSGRNAIDMGGFMGSDPAPSLERLQHFIASGELHYVLLSSASGDFGRRRGGPGASGAATQARDAWVRSHGTLVKVPGVGSAGTAMALYYLR